MFCKKNVAYGTERVRIVYFRYRVRSLIRCGSRSIKIHTYAYIIIICIVKMGDLQYGYRNNIAKQQYADSIIKGNRTGYFVCACGYTAAARRRRNRASIDPI